MSPSLLHHCECRCTRCATFTSLGHGQEVDALLWRLLEEEDATRILARLARLKALESSAGLGSLLNARSNQLVLHVVKLQRGSRCAADR